MTGQAFEAFEAAAGRHGGTIEAVSGEAITAVFGLPVVHEDDALRGVRAAADARKSLLELGVTLDSERTLRLDFRIGISTGEVVSGGSAAAQARATGEPLTLSARLGDDASAGEIRIDPATRAVLREAVVADPVGGIGVSSTLPRSRPGVSARLIRRWLGVRGRAGACRTHLSRRSVIVPASSSLCSESPVSASRGLCTSSSNSSAKARVSHSVAASHTERGSRIGRCSRLSRAPLGSTMPSHPTRHARHSPVFSKERTAASWSPSVLPR